ncbi:hypothetical protein [Geobacter pickeringii]|uniref:Uncharacterized protein n=1 Tax=Geobacter pickeringii TaxID=345632 RepID=A0A0B5B8L7_9BACT|nr:hypothetical protein [Geobacter pickeringii]AJE02887.1 hypothetical protein GPICK_05455 [Geobacter pickeringii]
MVEPLFESPAAPEPMFFAEVEEVSPADDLWGAFELEDEVVEEVASPAPGRVEESSHAAAVALASVETAGFGIPAEEDFAFGIEEEPVAPESAATEQFEALSADTFSFESVSAPPADPFAFEVEEPAVPVVEEPSAAFAAPVVDSFVPAFEEPIPPVVEQQFAPEEEYVPAEAPIAPVATTAAPAGTITLTEEQLAAAISRISREIIEKIAWEVVPDLAETLIKEEIRKIKEGS